MSIKLGIAAAALAASTVLAMAASNDNPAPPAAKTEADVKVEAPHTRVETDSKNGRRVAVDAPYADVKVDRDRVRVKAPFVDIEIPRR